MGGRLVAFETWYEGDDTSKPGRGEGVHENADPQIDVDLTKRHIEEMTVSLGIGLEGEYEADFVQGLTFHLDDGSTQTAGSSDEFGAGVIKFQVPDDHYTSSFNVTSRFDDKSRGWLYNDLARTIYFGFKLEEDVFA